jgi:hypothetical protein
MGDVGLDTLFVFGEIAGPDDTADEADGDDEYRVDEKEENGDGVVSKSDSGDDLDGSVGSRIVS